MIERDLALQARSVLSNCIAVMVEDEHVGIVTAPPSGGEEAHAERLSQLGADVSAVASALAVILRRTEVIHAGS